MDTLDGVTAADLEASDLRCVNCEWRPKNPMRWRQLGTPPCPKCGHTRFLPCATSRTNLALSTVQPPIPVRGPRTSWEILNDEVEDMADVILAEETR